MLQAIDRAARVLSESLIVLEEIFRRTMDGLRRLMVAPRLRLNHRKSAHGQEKETVMLSNSHNCSCSVSEAERAYLESLIRADYERCHTGETLEDIKLRAAFSREDKGLLRDWMAVAAARAAAEHHMEIAA